MEFQEMSAVVRRVPIRYVHLLRDVLRDSGVAIERVLAMADIEHALLENPDATLSSNQMDAFIMRSIRMTGRTDLGFELGRRIKMNSHDILGYGLISCPTMDAFLRMSSRHYHLMLETWSMRYRRSPGVGECIYTPLVGLSPHSMQFYLEALALAHQNQLQLILGSQLTAYDIYISMPEPLHIQRYRSLYPARFHFRSSEVPGIRVLMSAEILDIPLALGDEKVMHQIDQRCSALGRKPPRGELGWSEYIMMVLREGHDAPASMEDIAQRVQVSARTIDRHLKKEGLGFRELSDKVRFERACAMLSVPQVTVSHVALQLGFSNAANFTRAFRRVMGVTPGEYQRKPRST